MQSTLFSYKSHVFPDLRVSDRDVCRSYAMCHITGAGTFFAQMNLQADAPKALFLIHMRGMQYALSPPFLLMAHKVQLFRFM